MPRSATIVAVAALLTLLAGLATAQTDGGGATEDGIAAQVNDPTAPVTLIQFRDVIAPNLPEANGTANVLELQPIIPIPAGFLPFDQLIKATLPILATTPSPDSATGLGDFEFFDLVTIKQAWGRWGFGPIVVFPTATREVLGQGKWQAGPSAALIYTGTENLIAGAVLQNPISFAGDSSRPSVNVLIVTPTLTYNLPKGWFAGYSDFDWTFDWKDGGAATIPIGAQVGKVFTIGTLPLSFSLEAGYNVVRPSHTATPRWLVGVEFTVIVAGHRKAP